MALDEGRGLLYAANFGGRRIDVISLATRQSSTAFSVPPYPGSLALSPDDRFLLVAHFGNFQAPTSPANALTLIDLRSQAQQVFALSDPPLGVAFGADGLALIVTSTEFLLLDPWTGSLQVLSTITDITAKTLPAPPATFPPQITTASLGVSGDGNWIFGLTDTLYFRYDVRGHLISAVGYTSTPAQGPRVVSVSQEGEYFTAGWGLFSASGLLVSEFPNPSGAPNVGSHAIDSIARVIYAQVPQAQGQSSGSSGLPVPPVLMVTDADSLTVRDQLVLPENLAGRSLLNRARNIMFSVSDSGVMILPVGSLNQTHRLAASREDVLFESSYCTRHAITRDVLISDPGGGATDFTISATIPGISVAPASGTTPATVHITVEPESFGEQTGTITGFLHLTSHSAVNLPADIRVLINHHAPEQRGTIVDVPGTLVDILADPSRNRFYLLRQDKNEVLVFDGSSFQPIAALRTFNTPTQMAISFDQSYLLVGHDNSQLAAVFDLNTLQPLPPIVFPQGHYPRSIASSGNATLAASRVAGPVHTIDRIDLEGRRAFTLASLGPWENNININTVLVASANGASILAAMPDGNVMLYDSSADSFVASRKDFQSLSGVFAASNFDSYVVDKHVLDSSLAPLVDLDASNGASSGFVFLDQGAVRTTVAAADLPGTIARVDPTEGLIVRPTGTAEAALTGQKGFAFTRTLAALSNRNALVSLTVSGFTAISWNYDAAVAPPALQKVVNAADGSSAVASGGLISVRGNHLSPLNIASSQIPLPTALGESCLAINGMPAPMLFVSAHQINAQVPFEVDGGATMILHTPGGISNPLNFIVQPVAPSIFHTGTAGPQTGIPLVYRAKNHQLVTTANPIHAGEAILIDATGLGATVPPVATGFAASATQPAPTAAQPDVSLAGATLPLYQADLVPGQVGVYEIKALVPGWAPTGMQLPLTITQGSTATTVKVRVIH